jgi:glycosyltransferase involved in cell wall biosynthesis
MLPPVESAMIGLTGASGLSASPLRMVLLADAAHVNCQRWCEGLSQAGTDIHVLSFNRTSKMKQVYQLPLSPLPGKLHYLAAVPYVRRLIAAIRPHLVVAYYVTGYGTLAALAGHHPLVMVTSGSDILLAPRSPILRRLLRYNLNRADLVTAWAPHMAEAVRRLGVAPQRIFTLPRGIPLGQFARIRCSRPKINDVVYLISTRSLKEEYNPGVLLLAIRLLRDRGVSFILTLAGDGPQRGEVVALAQKLGLERHVKFLGFVPNDKLPALLMQHHLYISLVASDGVSASLLEAMAVGLLPLVPDHPANRLWIEPGVNGVLLDNLSPAAVAEALRRAVEDFSLRLRAWQQNPAIVHDRADLHRNSSLFVERFRRLATTHPGECRVKAWEGNPIWHD